MHTALRVASQPQSVHVAAGSVIFPHSEQVLPSALQNPDAQTHLPRLHTAFLSFEHGSNAQVALGSVIGAHVTSPGMTSSRTNEAIIKQMTGPAIIWASFASHLNTIPPDALEDELEKERSGAGLLLVLRCLC
jgi:hypothetical protein